MHLSTCGVEALPRLASYWTSCSLDVDAPKWRVVVVVVVVAVENDRRQCQTADVGYDLLVIDDYYDDDDDDVGGGYDYSRCCCCFDDGLV
jgi:hypothetical protein